MDRPLRQWIPSTVLGQSKLPADAKRSGKKNKNRRRVFVSGREESERPETSTIRPRAGHGDQGQGQGQGSAWPGSWRPCNPCLPACIQPSIHFCPVALHEARSLVLFSSWSVAENCQTREPCDLAAGSGTPGAFRPVSSYRINPCISSLLSSLFPFPSCFPTRCRGVAWFATALPGSLLLGRDAHVAGSLYVQVGQL